MMGVSNGGHLTATRRCRGDACGAEIAILKTLKDRAIPVDLEPSPIGRLRLVGDKVEVLNPTDARAALARGELLYVSHFATCPNAPAFRARTSRQRSDTTR